MPIALGLLLLDIMVLYHSASIGHLQPWAFVLLMLPAVAALPFVVVGALLEWLGEPHAQ